MSVIFALTLFAVCLGASARCMVWEEIETLYLCKGGGGDYCVDRQSDEECSNIIPNEIYKSAFTKGGHGCYVYADVDCPNEETFLTVFEAFQEIPFPPRSFKCNCY